jgi:hypothetical protein
MHQGQTLGSCRFGLRPSTNIKEYCHATRSRNLHHLRKLSHKFGSQRCGRSSPWRFRLNPPKGIGNSPCRSTGRTPHPPAKHPHHPPSSLPPWALSHQLLRDHAGRFLEMYGNRQSDRGRARFRLQEGTPQTPKTVLIKSTSEKDIMQSTTLILAAALFAALADAAPTPLRMVRRSRKCPEGGPSHPTLVPLRRWGFLRRWPLRWLPQWQKEAVAL